MPVIIYGGFRFNWHYKLPFSLCQTFGPSGCVTEECRKAIHQANVLRWIKEGKATLIESAGEA